MFWQVFTHEYFWLSFLPISFLGAGFWLLFFERVREQKDPLGHLFLAMGAGFLATVAYSSLGTLINVDNFWVQIWWEEWFKVMAAVLAMEVFNKRLKLLRAGSCMGLLWDSGLPWPKI